MVNDLFGYGSQEFSIPFQWNQDFVYIYDVGFHYVYWPTNGTTAAYENAIMM